MIAPLFLLLAFFAGSGFAQQAEKNDVLLRRAAVYIEAKRIPEAKVILSAIEAKSKEDEFVLNLLNGQIFLDQDAPAEALVTFNKAQSLSEGSYRSALGIAFANIRLGKITAARINAETLRKMDPASGEAELVLASCDVLLGKGQAAHERMTTLVQSRPDSARYAVAYAKFLMRSGDSDAARSSLVGFTQRYPNSPEALELAAAIDYQPGAPGPALELMAKAAALYAKENKNFNREVAVAWMEARQSAVGIDVLKKDPAVPEILKKETPAVENLKKEPGPVVTPPASAAINKQNPVVNIVDQKIHPFPFPPGVMITAGSGFIVDSGRKIVTNRHVVEGGKEFAVRTGLGEIIKAKVLFMSASDDLAVLELDKPLASDRSIPANAYSKPGVGRNVVVMGYPLWSMLGQGAPSLTNGMVSKRTGLQDDKGTFQITAKVNKGNSGGPVFDLSGNVVGITVGKLDTKKIQDEQGFIPEDINFAIHVDRLPPMVNMKLEGKEPVAQELGTEELYQAMLGKVVMVATYK